MGLRDYQVNLVAEVGRHFRRGAGGVCMVLGTGGGKCLARGTPVMMHSGEVRLVEDIAVGDLLMGPDSQPRRVETLARGREMMCRVTPTKGDAYTVNESHILSLKITGIGDRRVIGGNGVAYKSGDIVNISVKDYLKSSAKFKHCAKGWRVGVDYPSRDTHRFLPPYILGVWLGDGTEKHPEISTVDHEVLTQIAEYAISSGQRISRHGGDGCACPTYRVCAYVGKENRMISALSHYNLLANKHIPDEYLYNDRSTRLELLAGLIDTDGYLRHGFYEITVKSDLLAKHVLTLARSLGFAAYDNYSQKKCCNTGAVGFYHRINISGNVDQIPCRIKRRVAGPRKQIKNPLVTAINIQRLAVDDYFGFELSGPDRLFLLGDFTVTHNTRTASYMVGKWAERNQQVGWLVHRQELLMQAAMTFAEYGIEHRLVCSDSDARAIKAQQFREFGRSFVKHDALTVVGTVQTVARHLESVASWFNPAMLVADECHLSIAAGWVKVLTRWEKAKLLGLTGTPERLDGKALGRSSGGLYDEMVLGPSVGEMIENGYLAPYRLWRPNVHLNPVDLKMKGKDYDASTLEKELEGPVIFGDVIGHYRRYAHGTPAIGFCPTVASAKHFAAAFADAGYRAVSIDGMTDDALRRRTLAALGAGDLDVVFNCGILTEGTDIPLATTAIMLRRTLSLAMYLQSVGRVLRTHERKDYARVIDCVGVSLIHGYPDDEREWSLDGRPKKKRGESEREIELMRCPSCWEEHLPRKTCPACGHSYGEGEVVRRNKEMQQVDADLVEVSEDQRRAEQAEKRRKIGRARTLDELKDLALELGYSKGWAYRIYEARKQKEGVTA